VGNGGEINITTGSLSVSNGAVLNAFTSGKGNAGRVNIVARDTVTLDNGKILSSVEPTGVGNSGGIKITTNSISITNEGELRATNLGQGNAGDIQVNSSLIRLDNQAGIRSQTTSGNGGNISLEVRDLLLLRRGSEISTTAGTAGAGGNGGNITINAPYGFIVAASNENSDITANAFSGSGGRVTINANNIFGIAPLIRQDLENLRPNDLDPAQLSTNDITAISQQNPSLSGTVELNTPDVDPSQDLVQLPINVVDASQQIDTSCNPGSRQIASSFLITGRGGLPPNPQEFLIHDSVLVDLVNLQPDTENRLHRTVTSQKTTVTFNTPEPIVEANTWVKNDKGEVVLMSNLPTAAPHNPWLTSASCRSFY
jgi:large exoprotein involved in heme utilization and adhesion